MAKRKSEAKRARVWGYTWGDGARVELPYQSTRKAAELRATDYRRAGDATARAVRMVEVRKGEVLMTREKQDEFDRLVSHLVFSGVLTGKQAERLNALVGVR